MTSDQIRRLLGLLGVADPDDVVSVVVCVHGDSDDSAGEPTEICLQVTRRPEHVVLTTELELVLFDSLDQMRRQP